MSFRACRHALRLGIAAVAGLASIPAPAQTLTTAPGSETPSVRLPPPSRFYGGIDYLLWSVKDAPLSVPLLSTGPDGDPNSMGGFLRSPNSTVLYGAPHSPASGGKDHQQFPLFSGSRLTMGYWLDEAHTRAVEGSFFLLQQQSAGYRLQGDASGNPATRIPLYNSEPYFAGGVGMLVPPLEDGVPVALPGDLTGNVTFKNTLQLWGADATGVMTFYRDPSWELSGLAGFRYLNLTERFALRLNLAGFANTPYAAESGWTTDDFKTENQFFGGTLGVRGRYSYGPFSAELTTKLAVGLSHESESISGNFAEFNTPLITSTPFVTNGLRTAFSGSNGIFAQPSNEGHRSTDKLAIVPEAQVKLGYDVTPWLRLTVGYDFIYYSSVLRPVDQIDRSFSKGLPFQQDPNSTVGPTQKLHTTDFYAQGLNIGATFKF